jgi:NAD(P)-dependent dehydrogenase (short-subunit alcohol dehydrogenase family)
MLKDPSFGGPKPPFRAPTPSGGLDPKPDHGERTYLGRNMLLRNAAYRVGRPAQPAEIAPAYVFPASRDASFITGAVLPVAGKTIGV